MIILTHRLLGNFIYKYIDEQTPYANKLDRRVFVYGNMKPDIEINYRTMSHYYCQNQEYVYQLFNDLCTKAYTVITFSDQLGVLLHFLADYTCVFHSSSTLESTAIQKHITYETKLHFSAARLLKLKNPVTPIQFSSIDEVKQFIQLFIADIDNETKRLNVKRDSYFMTLLTLSVALYVLQKQTALKSY